MRALQVYKFVAILGLGGGGGMLVGSSQAAADPIAGAAPAATDKKLDLGVSLGARIFSDTSQLGVFDPAVPGLAPTAVIVPRLTWRVLESLWIEGELPIAPTTTERFDTSVFWFAPRALATWNAGGQRVRALVSLGVDMPVALSSAGGIFENDVSVSGVAGLGVAWSQDRLTWRLDARHMLTLARDPDYVTSEWEFTLGLSYKLIKKPKATPVIAKPSDADGDGIPDEDDKCPDRAEDQDGYEDGDGCPDIDDDQDGILDDIDKCKSIPETANGFEDDDGCPDSLPGEFSLILGPIEGLTFKAGSDDVAGSTRRLDAIAAVLKKYPGARIRLVGYLSEGEVKAGDEGPNVTGAEALGRARAEAVKAELEVRGVNGARVILKSRGGEQASGDMPWTNRQVELQMDAD